MSDIDPEKLEEAIEQYEQYRGDVIGIVVAAARAHLATFQRWKSLEIEQFAVVGWDGRCHGCWREEKEANLHARRFGNTVVRLTGTAKVRA